MAVGSLGQEPATCRDVGAVVATPVTPQCRAPLRELVAQRTALWIHCVFPHFTGET